MIIKTYETCHIPFGRHIIKRETDFYEGVTPLWVTINGSNITRAKGTISGVTSISSFIFDLESSEAVSQKFYNINFKNNSTANVSIKFIKDDLSAYFELATDNVRKKDILTYHAPGIEFENADVDYVQGKRCWGLFSYVSTPIGTKPRNLELILSPTNKFLAIIENDVLIYEWDFSSNDISFSGNWKCEINSDIPFDLSGLKYTIEKNF